MVLPWRLCAHDANSLKCFSSVFLIGKSFSFCQGRATEKPCTTAVLFCPSALWCLQRCAMFPCPHLLVHRDLCDMRICVCLTTAAKPLQSRKAVVSRYVSLENDACPDAPSTLSVLPLPQALLQSCKAFGLRPLPCCLHDIDQWPSNCRWQCLLYETRLSLTP